MEPVVGKRHCRGSPVGSWCMVSVVGVPLPTRGTAETSYLTVDSLVSWRILCLSLSFDVSPYRVVSERDWSIYPSMVSVFRRVSYGGFSTHRGRDRVTSGSYSLSPWTGTSERGWLGNPEVWVVLSDCSYYPLVFTMTLFDCKEGRILGERLRPRPGYWSDGTVGRAVTRSRNCWRLDRLRGFPVDNSRGDMSSPSTPRPSCQE